MKCKISVFIKFLLVALGFMNAISLFAGEYYDADGAMIVETLRKDYPIPIDGASPPGAPVKGVYWTSFSYWSGLRRIHSSEISIYGVKDAKVQNDILKCISGLKTKKIVVIFYDDSRFNAHYDAKGTGGVERLPSPVLRREYLK